MSDDGQLSITGVSQETVVEILSRSSDHTSLILSDIQLSIECISQKSFGFGKNVTSLHLENVAFTISHDAGGFGMMIDDTIFSRLLQSSKELATVSWHDVHIQSANAQQQASFLRLKHFDPPRNNKIRKLSLRGEKSQLIPRELCNDLAEKLRHLTSLALGNGLGCCDETPGTHYKWSETIICLEALPELVELALYKLSNDPDTVSRLLGSVGSLVKDSLSKLEFLLVEGVQIGEEMQYLITDAATLQVCVLHGEFQDGSSMLVAEDDSIVLPERPLYKAATGQPMSRLRSFFGGPFSGKLNFRSDSTNRHEITRFDGSVIDFLRSSEQGRSLAGTYWAAGMVAI